jgi:thiol-disulfide isomerase/thioredoxin
MKKQLKKLLLYGFMLLAGQCKAQTIPAWKLTDLQAALQKATQPTIFNFWATICKPCMAEFPHFQSLVKQYESQGVKLILVSLDLKEAYPKKIAAISSRLKLTTPIVFLNESNADLFCPAVDSSWSGVIPASIFINNATGYRKFFEQELNKEKFEAEIINMLRGKK